MSELTACTSRNWSESAPGTAPVVQVAPPSVVRTKVPPALLSCTVIVRSRSVVGDVQPTMWEIAERTRSGNMARMSGETGAEMCYPGFLTGRDCGVRGGPICSCFLLDDARHRLRCAHGMRK